MFVDGSDREHIGDVHVPGLGHTVDTADALLDAHWVPRQVVVDHRVRVLQVETLGSCLGGDQDA